MRQRAKASTDFQEDSFAAADMYGSGSAYIVGALQSDVDRSQWIPALRNMGMGWVSSV